MTEPAPSFRALAIGSLAASTFLVWIWFAYWVMRPEAKVMEPPAPEVRQADGSLVLERKLDPAAKPAKKIPAGAKVERLVSIKVKPNPPAANPAQPTSAADCPEAQVDLSLVKMPDETRRVIASSPNGAIVGGLDVPVEPTMAPPSRKWAAGLSWDPVKQAPGIWLDRDIGRIRLGVELNQVRHLDAGPVEVEGRIRLGVRF